jgi:hypothetical protein
MIGVFFIYSLVLKKVDWLSYLPEIVLPALSDKGGNHIASMLKTQLKQVMEQVNCNNLLVYIHTVLINLDFREGLRRYLLSHRTVQDA